MRAIDLTGRVFGDRRVVSRAGSGPQGVLWNCVCKCGEKSVVAGKNLLAGRCARCRRCAWYGGQSYDDLYKTWQAMILRCVDPSHPAYPRYGGRGIKVCRRWQKFENFKEDMGDKPTPQHTLDRKNNDAGYTPKNCRWATSKEQNRNRRDNVLVTYKGVTKLLVEWAEELGIKHATLYHRIHVYGWPVTKAFTQPVRRWSR